MTAWWNSSPTSGSSCRSSRGWGTTQSIPRRWASSRPSPAGTSSATCLSAFRIPIKSRGRNEPGHARVVYQRLAGAALRETPMGGFIARRLLQGLLLLLLVATAVFLLVRLTGNPVDLMLPEDATPADRERLIAVLGLDGSLLQQYVAFITNALKGDLGTSLRMRQPPVAVFLSPLPN